jgi:hypothetical protein
MPTNKIASVRVTKQQAVERQLAQLPNMSRGELRRLWKQLFDREPSPMLRREVLMPILAYRIQEKAYGGLKESTARRLRELAEGCTVGNMPSARPKTGTRYIREYAGKLHEVTVLDDGYEYEGAAYRSLTEITKVITGAKWSGPAFFGLKRKIARAAV